MGEVLGFHQRRIPLNESRYFLAILPDADTANVVSSLKEYCSESYGTKAALRSPPHITLHMPFHWKTSGEAKLIDALQQFAIGELPFAISLRDFGCFSPRVIFIAVEKNEQLHQCQRKLDRFCKVNLNLFDASYRDQPFHPHITIAFRDLKKTVFPIAWEEFKTKPFKADFTCDSFWLLKHDGQVWHPHHQLKFGPGVS